MATLQIKPTRMELQNLKKKTKVAVRGHKLMKDKRDELVRRFIGYVKRNKMLRARVENQLSDAMAQFVLARASMSREQIEEALSFPANVASITAGTQNILSIDVPQIELIPQESVDYPYGFSTTSSELDEAVHAFAELVPLLIKLAENEKICNRLADEIEKTRRRVNALEYVMIPQFQETARRISMKLDENERGNLTRLMKTKDMIKNR